MSTIIEKINKVKELKDSIYKCQINKLGNLTKNNLIRLDYSNNDYLTELDLLEQQKQLNDEYINAYNTKKTEFNKIYNTEQIVNDIKKNHNKEINDARINYENTYKELQETLKTMEYNRLSAVNLNSSFKVDIDIKNAEIVKKKKYKLLLEEKIEEFTNKKNVLNDKCNKELEKIENSVETSNKEASTLTGGNIGNIETIYQKCKTIGYKNTQELFLDKYIIYLTKFDNMCKLYSNSSNITKSCIRFTDEQVKNKINELKVEKSNFNKDNYVVDEELLLKEHNSKIENIKKNNKNILTKKNNYYNLQLDNIRKLISYYQQLKPINTSEQNTKLINELDTEILDLDNTIGSLENNFKNLNNTIRNHVHNCNVKIYNLKKLKKIEK